MAPKADIGDSSASGVAEFGARDALAAPTRNNQLCIESPATSPVAADISASANSWIVSARFLLAWLPVLLLGLYTKWYALKNLNGLENVAHSMGFLSLGLAQRLSFFRGDILIGFLTVPALLLVLNRYIKPFLAAVVTMTLGVAFLILLAIQLRALDEVGRYISLDMMLVALHWGLHEPGANVGYLSMKGLAGLVGAVIAVGIAVIWAFRQRRAVVSRECWSFWRAAAELYVFAAFVIVAVGWWAQVPTTPYHESAIVRSVVSLWRENAVDTGEFAAFDFERGARANIKALPSLSTPALIRRYRELAHVPPPDPDPRYFGRERGDNVLFIVLETTPSEFLPANDDMKQFPNLARLREQSFVGTRHYTTLPMTVTALFSAFTSWYPMDSLSGVHGFPDGEFAPDFLSRLSAAGYETAVFTPLLYPNREDEDMYRAVDFQDRFFRDPNAALPSIPGYTGQPAWKGQRIGADIVTLQKLEANLDEWIRSRRKFVAAFAPQIAHFPYPDLWPDDDTAHLRTRGRAIIAQEDIWIGQLMNFLAARGQLDKTIIVIFGDHGRRNIRENPNLRRGTIDETAFHVPLLIYAPHALNHTVYIPWVTSHIDIVPTVLGLLGVTEDRESEQGSAIWNPQLDGRTTFLFAQPTFGADGYVSNGRWYMWNYSSNVVYENSSAVFHSSDFVLGRSAVAGDVTSTISTMVSLEKTWHLRFAQPSSERQASPVLPQRSY